MYDFEWHDMHSKKTMSSALLVLDKIREVHPYDSLIDIGCGSGIWLKASEDLGCPSNKGVDGVWTDLEKVVVPQEAIAIQDLSHPFYIGRFDIAISLEVAEHISAYSAEVFIDNLIKHSDVIVFGAAIPYQGGFRHINEQWQSFWQGKFAAREYKHFDLIRPQIWHEENAHFWYKQNILLYVKESRTDLTEKITNHIKENVISSYPVDFVHPEIYESLASYDQIAFKPLLRKLPSRLLTKSRSVILRKI